MRYSIPISLSAYFIFTTKQALYVSHKTEVHLCNNCRSRKAKYYIFQKCVSVALGIQHELHKHHTVICDLSGSTIFFHIISSMVQF